LLESIVRDVVGCQVASLHTDISARTGERVVVLTVDANLEKHFR
jgi:uncharacterized protein YbcI